MISFNINNLQMGEAQTSKSQKQKEQNCMNG